MLTDEKWFCFALEQILSNALKYTKQGSVKISAEETENGLQIFVKDTGIGIKREDLPRIFEKGFTGYNGREEGHSSGIGLYLCGKIMKKLEIIIRPERLDDLKNILNSNGAHGLMITNIMGYGSQKGHKQVYNGVDFGGNLLPKVKVESIVSDETYENIIDQIIEEINTGVYGDGKIFVYEVSDAIRIRTGERGNDAL